MLHKDVLDCKVKVCALEFGRSTFSKNVYVYILL